MFITNIKHAFCNVLVCPLKKTANSVKVMHFVWKPSVYMMYQRAMCWKYQLTFSHLTLQIREERSTYMGRKVTLFIWIFTLIPTWKGQILQLKCAYYLNFVSFLQTKNADYYVHDSDIFVWAFNLLKSFSDYMRSLMSLSSIT